jgi:hypothetical protein
VEQAYSMVDGAEATSLTVFSGYRFVRCAAAHDIPTAIVNRGRTRGDGLATVKVDGGCSPILTLLADDAALELIDEALQIAERCGDDFALAHARYALGLALMHRDSPTDRERGLTVLTQLRDMCLHEHWARWCHRGVAGSRGRPSMRDGSPGASLPPACSWRRCWPAAARLICRKPRPRSSG